MLALLSRTPRAVASRAFGRLADAEIPRPLRGPLIGGFARIVGARMDEARQPAAGYSSLNAFFARRLAPGNPGVAVGRSHGDVARRRRTHPGSARWRTVG